MDIKWCYKCKKWKPLKDFYKNKRYKDGLRYECIDCTKEIASDWYNNNRERSILKVRKWQNDNKERHINNKKEYRLKNKNKEREKQKEYIVKREQVDSVFKLQRRIRKNIYKTFVRRNIKKGTKSREILGCDYDTFKKYLESQFQTGMNWDNYGEWEFDHIIPISLAKTEADVIKLNYYTNFQPLWREDNNKKSNKI